MRAVATHLLCLLLTLSGTAVYAEAAAKIGAEPRSFSQIMTARTLRVGVYPATPYVMKGVDGKFTGAEIDVAERLAKDLGIAAQFRQYEQWEQLVPALQRGEIDIIISGFSITPERALQVYF